MQYKKNDKYTAIKVTREEKREFERAGKILIENKKGKKRNIGSNDEYEKKG